MASCSRAGRDWLGSTFESGDIGSIGRMPRVTLAEAAAIAIAAALAISETDRCGGFAGAAGAAADFAVGSDVVLDDAGTVDAIAGLGADAGAAGGAGWFDRIVAAAAAAAAAACVALDDVLICGADRPALADAIDGGLTGADGVAGRGGSVCAASARRGFWLRLRE